MTGCDCPLAGYCERHGVDKTPHLLHLCRTDDRYWAAWEEGRGIGQRGPQAEREPRVRQPPPPICIHRGDVLGPADCGCSGSPKVYQCGVHGLAMDRKLRPGKVTFAVGGKKQSADVAYCFGCDEYATEPSEDPGQLETTE